MTNAQRTVRPSRPMPRTREDIERMMDRIALLRATRDQHKAQAADDIAQIVLFRDGAIRRIEEEEQQLVETLQAWCEINRDFLTESGRVKAVQIGQATVGWRKNPPSIEISDGKAVLAELENRKLQQFVRVSRTLDKEAMLKAPEMAATVTGVTVRAGDEVFFIKTRSGA